MSFPGNILATGSTGSGKTQGAARTISANPDEAAVILDPHERSLARTALQHLDGNVLFERLSDLQPCLRCGFL
jgi:hypothetical protein